MEKNRMLVLIVLVLMLTPMAVFAGGKKEEPVAPIPTKEQETKASPEAAEPETITITDGVGREVVITKPVKRIVCGSADNTEIVKMLGATDRVVGVDLFTTTEKTLFPKLSELESVVGEHGNLNYELIFELHPDLFIACTGWAGVSGFEEVIEKLEPEIPVVFVNFLDPASLIQDVRTLGLVLDNEEEAEEFIAFYQKIMNDIDEKIARIPEENKPRVFYETYSKYATFSSEMLMYAVQIAIAGGINIAADISQVWGKVDPEWVMEQNPDIITKIAYPKADYPGVDKTSCGYDVDDPTEIKALRDSIMNRPELEQVKAVKTGKVYMRHYHLQDTPRFFVGITHLAKWFHPDLFADLDPLAIHQEYLTRFMRIDYDLDKHGVFVYPEP